VQSRHLRARVVDGAVLRDHLDEADEVIAALFEGVLGQDPGRSYLRTLGAMRLPPNLLGGAAGGAFTEAQGEQCAGVGCGH